MMITTRVKGGSSQSYDFAAPLQNWLYEHGFEVFSLGLYKKQYGNAAVTFKVFPGDDVYAANVSAALEECEEPFDHQRGDALNDDIKQALDAVDEFAKLAQAEKRKAPSGFKAGDVVLCQKGDSFELGTVKRVCDDGSGDCFVWYHTGDTAARTRAEDLRKIENLYAFEIRRKNWEEK